ncbi:MAG: hypothetical protein FJX29_04775 [Alphaproteobacteria bacterium]|nr:hypothetical protein [Alphaproteobacteria bacterium]
MGLKNRFGMLSIAAMALAGAAVLPAQAQQAQPDNQAVMKECGARWQSAKAANKTGDQTWPQFLSQCRADMAKSSTGAKPAPAAAQAPAKPAPAAQAPAKPAPAAAKPAAAGAAGTAAAGGFIFPRAIDAKYSTEKPGQQRMKTCLDQYNANKASGKGNGGKNWIEKGGGYYSECNKRLGGGSGATGG